MKTEQQIIDELKSMQNIAEHMGCPVVINSEHMAELLKDVLRLIGNQSVLVKNAKTKIENLNLQLESQNVDEFKEIASLDDWSKLDNVERIQYNMKMLLNRAKTNQQTPKFMIADVLEQAIHLDLKKSEFIELAEEQVKRSKEKIAHLNQLLERQAEEIEHVRANASPFRHSGGFASPFAGVVSKAADNAFSELREESKKQGGDDKVTMPHPSLVMTSEFSKKIFEDTQKKVIGDIKEQIKGFAAKSEIKPDALTVRDQLAISAPIDFELILKVWQDSAVNLSNDSLRGAFLAVGAMARYEYADAVIAARAAQEPKQDDDGWIEYKGGGCPVDPCVMVECKYIDKQKSKWAVPAFQIDWESRALPITNYRLAK